MSKIKTKQKTTCRYVFLSAMQDRTKQIQRVIFSSSFFKSSFIIKTIDQTLLLFV